VGVLVIGIRPGLRITNYKGLTVIAFDVSEALVSIQPACASPTNQRAQVLLGILCITLAGLWRADREGPQGVFLQPIARLLVRKTTQ